MASIIWLKKNINNNIFFYKSDYCLNKSVEYKQTHKIDGIAYSTGIEGNLSYKSMIHNEGYNCEESISNIHLISKDEVYHSMEKNVKYKAIYLILKRDFLEKTLPNSSYKDEILKNLDNEFFYKNIHTMKISIEMKYISNQIFYSPYENELNELFIESKILELSYHVLNLLLEKSKNIGEKGIKFSQYDIDALYKAKTILVENMKSPPSIIELSKIVKLNDFKLKIGFKKLFNITPFAFLFEERMLKAKYLLQSSELSVGEISKEVGYTQQQNFRKAFFNRFNILPKDIMKRRKYYY